MRRAYNSVLTLPQLTTCPQCAAPYVPHRVCPACGTLYNSLSRRPAQEGICDQDGATLEIRNDDRPEIVKARLEEYEARTAPVIGYFRGAGVKIIEVNASRRTPEQIFAGIQQELARGGAQ